MPVEMCPFSRIHIIIFLIVGTSLNVVFRSEFASVQKETEEEKKKPRKKTEKKNKLEKKKKPCTPNWNSFHRPFERRKTPGIIKPN